MKRQSQGFHPGGPLKLHVSGFVKAVKRTNEQSAPLGVSQAPSKGRLTLRLPGPRCRDTCSARAEGPRPASAAYSPRGPTPATRQAPALLDLPVAARALLPRRSLWLRPAPPPPQPRLPRWPPPPPPPSSRRPSFLASRSSRSDHRGLGVRARGAAGSAHSSLRVQAPRGCRAGRGCRTRRGCGAGPGAGLGRGAGRRGAGRGRSEEPAASRVEDLGAARLGRRQSSGFT